ncbi:TPA: hypothetical protein N0F65_005360 [Lagenidium giganteum]|uniref:Uncharacterized protein n=1 Tax=Lagenidium giganteum TaxID=4803 RepID=A0AAV2YHZ3_9STRA|nr:TPA: hypothetical protein N0F65_005360 [Lagenidium giganteum]
MINSTMKNIEIRSTKRSTVNAAVSTLARIDTFMLRQCGIASGNQLNESLHFFEFQSS